MKVGDRDNGPLSPLEIAAALLDGQEFDWAEAIARTPPSERGLLEKLRAIERVTAAHLSEPWSTPRSWGPLEIREKIGSGAFGEVYRAWDARLEREVALKLFGPARKHTPQPDTAVVEEGRLLARVRHPNVVTVHGVEQHDGRSGVLMELVEGTTLEDIIVGDGTLSWEEAVLIGRSLCRALAALHGAGIIHRDVKARNVVRERGGRIVLMDLGVSCEIDAQSALRPYGTPLYTAPEILDGEEARCVSDIYGVGVLLFFLVTGEFPVSGSSLTELREAHHDGSVRLLRDLRPDVPAGFIGVLEKALATTVDGRFATAGQMEQALIGVQAGDRAADKRRSPARLAATIAILLLAVVGIVAIGTWLVPRTGIWPNQAIEQASKPSLAVLPFENIGAPGQNDHLAVSLAAELTTRLARIHQIDVLSRAAVERYVGKRVDPQEIRQTFGVDYLLVGSVLVAEERFRLDVSFVDAETGFHVWADNLDGKLDDVFTFQDIVVARVGSVLGIASNIKNTQLDSRRWTESAEAYHCYLVGRELTRSYEIPQRLLAARLWFEQALAHDPEYAPAMAELAKNLGGSDWEAPLEPGAHARALALAHRAQEIDPSLAQAWRAEGHVLRVARPVAARAAYEHALALNPNHYGARWGLFGLYYAMFGERDLAVALIREGITVDPYQPVHYALLASVMIDEGRFAEADSLFAGARRLMPDNRRLQLYDAFRLWQEGLWPETIAAYRDLMAKYPDEFRAYYDLAGVLSSLGRPAEADSVLALAVARWPDIPNVNVAAARSSLALGHYEEAEKRLRSVIAADEHFILAWVWLAHCLLAQDRMAEAEATMLEVVARWPDYSRAYAYVCEFYLSADNPNEIERWAREMTVRFPELADGLSWLADAYRMRGDYEQAVEQYRHALAIRDVSFKDNLNLSRSLQNLGRLDEAVGVAQGWVERRPVHPEGWNLLGDLQRDAGQRKAAVAAYEKVLKFSAGTVLADSARAQLVAMGEH